MRLPEYAKLLRRLAGIGSGADAEAESIEREQDLCLQPLGTCHCDCQRRSPQRDTQGFDVAHAKKH